MNFKLLPNHFKKIGLTVFFISFFLGGGDSFMDGFKQVNPGTHHYFKDLYGPFLSKVISVSPIIGLLLYLLSKEKIEDEYIKLFRLETFQTATIIGLLIGLVLYVFNENLKFSLESFLFIYLLIYFFILSIKKSNLE